MSTPDKHAAYETAHKQLMRILQDETNVITQMATVSCVLSQAFDAYFWTGFYMVSDTLPNTLKVGPYQGTLGCLTIPFTRGVCGACATRKETIVVPDVHAFLGHIACDSRSQSEIVVPVFNADKELIAVFDVDSESLNSFDQIDAQWLQKILGDVFG